MTKTKTNDKDKSAAFTAHEAWKAAVAQKVKTVVKLESVISTCGHKWRDGMLAYHRGLLEELYDSEPPQP